MKNPIITSAYKAEQVLCNKLLKRNMLFASLLSAMMGFFVFRAFGELLSVAFPDIPVWLATVFITATLFVMSVFVFDAFLYERRRTFPLFTDIAFPIVIVLVAIILLTATEHGQQIISNVQNTILPEDTASNLWSLAGLIILGWIARILWIRRPGSVVLSNEIVPNEQSPQTN